MVTVTIPIDEYENMKAALRILKEDGRVRILTLRELSDENFKLKEQTHKIALILGMPEVKEEEI